MAQTFSAVRRRNVSPKSSVLKVVTREVDCSDWTYTPEDGEFIAPNWSARPTSTFFADSVAGVTATAVEAASMGMVWSSAMRSDRQALGHSNVPILAHGGIEVDCKLYEVPSASENLDYGGGGTPANANFVEGALVSVKVATTAIEGTAGRIVLTPIPAYAGGAAGWAVGYVVESNGPCGADKPVTVYLYDKPVFINTIA